MGHLLHTDLEEFLRTRKPDKEILRLKNNRTNPARTVVESRIVYRPVYEIDGKMLTITICPEGEVAFHNSYFALRVFKDTEEIHYTRGMNTSVGGRYVAERRNKKIFKIECDDDAGPLCLAYEKKEQVLDIILGTLTKDKQSLHMSDKFRHRYARIFLERVWREEEVNDLIQIILQRVNKDREYDPIKVLDIVWLYSLRKTSKGRNKVIPENCEIMLSTTMTLLSVIIVATLLGLTVFLGIFILIARCNHTPTVLNESGTVKSLLWSYANELTEAQTRCNDPPDERPRICISTWPEDTDHIEPELVGVAPIRSTNRVEERK